MGEPIREYGIVGDVEEWSDVARQIGLSADPGTVTRYGNSSNQTRMLSVDVLPGVEVRICPGSADRQEAGELLATLLRDAGPLLLRAADRIRHEMRKRSTAEHTAARLDGMSHPASVTQGACVREGKDGAVWVLGSAEKGWASFGVRYADWETLSRACPDLRPIGAGADATGPYVLMSSMSAVPRG